jgi:phosphatidyl-myo-inositol alpha-mannosyltransferase
VHEPMTPAVCVAALCFAQCPIVATHHAHGELAWMGPAMHFWGFLMDRIDARVAVSPMAEESAARFIPGPYKVIPNGVLIPEDADPVDRDHAVVFIGRHDTRKGLPVLLRAWPQLRGRGVRLRVIGADPLAVRLLLTRLHVSDQGIDLLGFVDDATLTRELSAAKLLVAPSLGNESFGMVITRALACATPVVASDIPGYREVVTPETGILTPPGDPDALADTVAALLADEPTRAAMGAAARERAASEYAWPLLARRLADCYERVLAA